MENQFVFYDLALKLKELGFDEECFGYYTVDEVLNLDSLKMFKDGDLTTITSQSDWTTLAPLWQQVFDFMIEKHNLVGTIYANASGYLWEIHDSAPEGGTHRAESGYDGDCQYSGTYTTYHKAREACLIKLIELVEDGKNK